MKKEDKILTYAQARELKFFCSDVIGTRTDYYAVMSTANKFDDRLKRLEKTCELIEQYLGEQIKSLYHPPVDWDGLRKPQPIEDDK